VALHRPTVLLAVFWIVGGILGAVVAFLLYLEYIGQLTGADAIISCQWGVLVTCGPNLLSPGGNILGFSNSIAGMVLFLGPVYAGVSELASPSGLRRWYWRTYGIFVAGAFVLVHYFAFQSIFVYGSLCPWCMIIWLVTIPLFWFTTGWMLRDGVWTEAPAARRVGSVIFSWALLATVLDYALIAVTAQLRLDLLGSF
jgi:uncharacterized membrane protein